LGQHGDDVEAIGAPASGTATFLNPAEVFKQEPTYVSGVPTATVGPPTTGSHVLNEIWKDAFEGVWKCTMAGTPGTWKQMLPAAVTADPSSGTIPTGYVILNVAVGVVKGEA
jgi:hypothetical protein